MPSLTRPSAKNAAGLSHCVRCCILPVSTCFPSRSWMRRESRGASGLSCLRRWWWRARWLPGTHYAQRSRARNVAGNGATGRRFRGSHATHTHRSPPALRLAAMRGGGACAFGKDLDYRTTPLFHKVSSSRLPPRVVGLRSTGEQRNVGCIASDEAFACKARVNSRRELVAMNGCREAGAVSRKGYHLYPSTQILNPDPKFGRRVVDLW